LKALLLGGNEGSGLGFGGQPFGQKPHGAAFGLQLAGIDEVREVRLGRYLG
jgi:hypothetical protein